MHRHTRFAVPCPAEVQLYPSMMNETLPQDRHAVSRIETLISKMTLAEKLGQLTMTASSYPALGRPSRRSRVCHYVYFSVVAVSFQNTSTTFLSFSLTFSSLFSFSFFLFFFYFS